MRSGIGDLELGLGLRIVDWDWGLVIWIGDLDLGIWIGDWDWILRIGDWHRLRDLSTYTYAVLDYIKVQSSW